MLLERLSVEVRTSSEAIRVPTTFVYNKYEGISNRAVQRSPQHAPKYGMSQVGTPQPVLHSSHTDVSDTLVFFFRDNAFQLEHVRKEANV